MDHIIPEYKVRELPSRLIGYPENCEIFIEPYSFGQNLNIKLVGQNSINMLTETLDGTTVKGDMEKNLITPQDIIFLGVYRNLMSSMHDKINVKSTCPKCLNDTTVQRTLKDIKFKTIEDFDRSVYPLELDLTEYTMWIGFVSYKDYEFCLTKYRGSKIHQLALQVVKYTKKSTGETLVKPDYKPRSSNKLATALIEKWVNEVKDILYPLVDIDKDVLNEAVDLLENYDLKPLEIQCSYKKCGHEYTVDFDEEGVLITPFRDTEESPRNRIKLSKSRSDESNSFETDEYERSGVTTGLNKETSQGKTKSVANPQIKDQIKYLETEES